MQVAKMKAEARSAVGRNQLRSLRAQGWLPAVVYGDAKDPQSISISEWEFEQHLKHHHRVYQLVIDGAVQDAFLQDIQFDALNDRPRHCDFKRIDLTKPMEFEVEVTLLGYPQGLGKGGVLLKDHMHLRVRCLPTAIPELLEVNIDHLDIDQALHARDVQLPEGVELATPPETSVCHVAKMVAQATAAPAAGEAAPAEGEAKAEGDKKPDAEKK
ncbi:MAG: 50S ribosomal protein L25 [Planctomycetota bacterium]